MTDSRICEITLYILAVTFALAANGYRYGHGNQVALLPAIYHIMDEQVLENDPFARDFPVSSRPIIWLAAQAGRVVPLPAVMFLLHLLSLLILLSAIRGISRSIRPRGPDSGWTVFFLLIASRFLPGSNLTLGGFDLFEQNYYGYTLGIAMVAIAMLKLLEGKPIFAGIMAGLTFYVHTNYGQHAILLLSGVILLGDDRWKGKTVMLSKVMGSFLAAALPTLIPLVINELKGASGVSVADRPGYLEILGFRNPHHIRPETWAASDHILFILSVVCFWYLLRKRQDKFEKNDMFWKRTSLIVILLCGIAYLNGLIGSDLIAKSYLFRTSILIKILLFVYATAYVHERLRNRFDAARLRRFALSGVAVTAIFTVTAITLNIRSSALGKPMMVLNRPAFYGMNFTLETTSLEQWVAENTPLDAVFLTPPDYFTFSVNTRRAGVVNWLNAPHRGIDYLEWYERIRDVTGGEVSMESTRGMDDARLINEKGRKAYEQLDSGRLIRLGKKYGSSYCIHPGPLPLEEVARSDGYVVYLLREAKKRESGTAG